MNLKDEQAAMRERNRAFPKPSEKEGKITVDTRERQKLLTQFYVKQRGLCITCQRPMTRYPGLYNTATLGHKNPEPKGCAKRDNPDNLLGAQCWLCNFARGSKRS